MCTQPIEKGMKNLAIILDNEKIKKIEHPEEVDKKLYGRFAVDDFLAFLLLEENFRGVVTQDNKFRKKVPKDKIVLDCSDLFR